MKSIREKLWLCWLLVLALFSAGISQETEKERLAILPFRTQSLSAEQGAQLTQRFGEALAGTGRFNVLAPAAMKIILEGAGFTKTDDCTTPPCLAQLGKVLGVERIVSASVEHPGDGFRLHVQLVDASDASLSYDQTVDSPGTYENLLTVVIPDQGRRLGTTELGTGTRWYVVAAAVLAGAGIIYWIYTSFVAANSTDTQSGSPTPAPK